jgi:Tfp pilus assembly protein PilF
MTPRQPVFVLMAVSWLVAAACRPPAGDAPTFTRDVAPIVFARCAPCHRPGQVAPFSLLTYKDVRGRAKQIARVTGRRFMPPWLPEPGYGEFAGERRLTDDEILTLRRWAEAGALEGEPADLPPLPAMAEGWRLGEPDLVAQLPETYTLPADGTDVFRNFAVPIPIATTRWVRGLEMLPDNPRVIHHATILFDRSEQARRRDAAESGPGWDGMFFGNARFPDGHLLGWTPGMTPFQVGDDLAWRLEPGTDLVVQLHLLPSGKEESIRPSFGFHFAPAPGSRKPYVLRLGSRTLDIPAGEKRYVIEDAFELPIAVEVLGLHPHAHYVCREMKGWAVLPDGTEQWLLSIPEWDFNWQDEYRFAAPVALPAGTVLRMRFTYDNSADNERNPNQPPRRVVYGPQSSDEMGDLWIQVLPADPAERPQLESAFVRKDLQAETAGLEKLWQLHPDDYRYAFDLADHYFADGELEQAEAALDAALRLEPGDADVHNLLGKVVQARGRSDQAIAHFQRALELEPEFAGAHLNLGNAFKAVRRPQEALVHYRRALEIAPDYVDAYNNLGNLLLVLGRRAEADAAYRRALQITPDSARTLNNLGVLLGIQGRHDEALRQFEQAVAIEPGYASARQNLERARARIARRKGQKEPGA